VRHSSRRQPNATSQTKDSSRAGADADGGAQLRRGVTAAASGRGRGTDSEAGDTRMYLDSLVAPRLVKPSRSRREASMIMTWRRRVDERTIAQRGGVDLEEHAASRPHRQGRRPWSSCSGSDQHHDLAARDDNDSDHVEEHEFAERRYQSSAAHGAQLAESIAKRSARGRVPQQCRRSRSTSSRGSRRQSSKARSRRTERADRGSWRASVAKGATGYTRGWSAKATWTPSWPPCEWSDEKINGSAGVPDRAKESDELL